MKKADQETVKKDLQPISHAQTLRRAQQAVKRFVRYWQTLYFKAIHCLTHHLPESIVSLRIAASLSNSALGTTNAIER
jgi:transposase-like protein